MNASYTHTMQRAANASQITTITMPAPAYGLSVPEGFLGLGSAVG